MKILFVHDRYLQSGGEDRVVEMETRLLSEHGHEVDLYEEHNSNIERIGIIKTALRCTWSQESFHSIEQLLAQKKYDVMHVHNFFPLVSPSVYYAAKKANVPIVQTLHNYRLLCANGLFYRDNHPCVDCINCVVPIPGIIHKCYRDSYLGSTALASMIGAHRIIGTWHNAVDKYIAVSKFLYEKFIEAGFPQDKLVIKSNFLYPDPGIGKGNGNYLLFVGRLSEEKGIKTLLTAWSQYMNQPVQLIIVGSGPLQPLVEKTCAEVSTIKFLGEVKSEHVIELMSNAKGVIVPSQWYEGSPNVIIEAFACGTPVLASGIATLANMVQPDHTGVLFESNNALDLANKVMHFWESLSNNQMATQSMRTACRQEYCLKYTAEDNYKQLIDIYTNVCGKQVSVKYSS